ncbi:MAG: cyclopentanol dehydrogenase, partial [Chloroflexi bacterium]
MGGTSTDVALIDGDIQLSGDAGIAGYPVAVPMVDMHTIGAGGGSIVNISSVAGLVGSRETTAYTASKGAVRLLTKSTAIQYASVGIRANSVHPGTIETPMTEGLLAQEGKRADRMNRTPLKRLGRPEDVAYGALFLASDEASFMTGSELVIDGGRTAE